MLYLLNYTRQTSLLILLWSASSCVNSKKAVYFNDVPENLVVNSAPSTSQTINPHDILGITVTSLNPEASTIFNSPPPAPYSESSGMQPSGYLVDQDGNIQFPVLGKIRAVGFTKSSFSNALRDTLIARKLLMDPVIGVRFLNFRITVLGEVAKPMVLPVPSEKISILEAIGMAGDLTIYGKRENVLLIREEEGKKTMTRINLNSKELFSSPYYYLKNGDVIYAEPNEAKIASATNFRQILPIVLSGLSFLAIIVDRITR